jgi:hypothetical protein
MRLVPRETAATPGGVLLVDVFIRGVQELRAIQAALEPSGGAAGAVHLERIQIDRSRQDFVFPEGIVDSAADTIHGRVVASLRQGAVLADVEHYFATFHYRVSEEASGSFWLRLDSSGTHLRDAEAGVVPVLLENSPLITVEPMKKGEQP